MQESKNTVKQESLLRDEVVAWKGEHSVFYSEGEFKATILTKDPTLAGEFYLDRHLPVYGIIFPTRDKEGRVAVPKRWFMFPAERQDLERGGIWIRGMGGNGERRGGRLSGSLLERGGVVELPKEFDGKAEFCAFVEKDGNPRSWLRGQFMKGVGSKDEGSWGAPLEEGEFPISEISTRGIDLRENYDRYGEEVELRALMLVVRKQKIACLWGDSKGKPVGFEWLDSVKEGLAKEGRRGSLAEPERFGKGFANFEMRIREKIAEKSSRSLL